MANRRLQLRRLQAALEQGRSLPVELQTRLLEAVHAALDGGEILDVLAPTMTRTDMEARNRHIMRARDALDGAGHEQLARAAEKVEARLVSGELDPERPGRWPAMREFEQHLALALIRGPMISRSQFYQIQSDQGADRTACDDHSQIKRAVENWSP